MKFQKFTLLATAIIFSGCASMSAVAPNSVLKTEAAFTVSPNSAWTHFPKSLNPTTGSALTQDGKDLGVVYLVTVNDGEAMLDDYDRSKSLPRYTKGQTPLESVDFVVTSLDRLGFAVLETTSVQPKEIDGISGTQMNLKGRYPNGLNMLGQAAFVETDKGLNVFVYIAPEMHYYEKYESQAAALFNSARF